MKLCLGCMNYIADGLNVCPYCGYIEGTPPKESYHISPGTIIHGKYIVGKVLGYGGFGITYIGWDYNLSRKVAIKEFLPSDFSTRIPGETMVTVYDGEATAQFEAGLERFVEEAQRLAKFNHIPGIVDIYDTFIENNTGYIVMQCLEGDTVKDLIMKNGIMPYESAKLIMVEILKTLSVVHKEGIIHRDISPDNIFITNDNEIKLLDFGAARYASTYHSKSLSVILKPGYAPEEQYRSNGYQGPWSDVYAAAATLYKMITNITIEESMERTVKDNVKSPLELNVDIPEGANNAIMNALNIHAELRTQSADAFIAELTADDVERVIDLPVKTDSGRLPKWLIAVAASVLSVAAIFATLVFTGVLDIGGIFYLGPVADASTRVPYVINQMKDDGEKKLGDDGFAMQISDQSYDKYAEKDIIKSQTPDSGQLGTNCETKDNKGRPVVYVTVSGGPAPVVVPDVMGMTLTKAKQVLEKAGFKVKTEEEYSDTYAKGTVLLQDVVDMEYAYGSTVTLTVSKGEMKVDSSKKHKIPNLVGMDYDAAAKKLMAIGMYANRVEKKDKAPENQVLKQSEKKGSELPEGTTITLTVSSNTIVIPNVVYKEKNTAMQLITDSGAVVGNITYEQNEQVKSGNVISQSKVGKSTFGAKVNLVISTGFDGKKAKEEQKKAEAAKEKAEAEAKKKAEQKAEEAKEKERLRKERKAKEEAQEEARLKLERKAKEKAEEEARIRKERDAKEKAEEEARLRKEREAKEKAEEEARLRKEREAKEKAEEEARLRKEREAKEKAEEEARLRKEREAKEKAEEEAKLKAQREAEDKKRAIAEAEAEVRKYSRNVTIAMQKIVDATEKFNNAKSEYDKALVLLNEAKKNKDETTNEFNKTPTIPKDKYIQAEAAKTKAINNYKSAQSRFNNAEQVYVAAQKELDSANNALREAKKNQNTALQAIKSAS